MHLGHCRGIRDRVCPGYRKPDIQPNPDRQPLCGGLGTRRCIFFWGYSKGQKGRKNTNLDWSRLCRQWKNGCIRCPKEVEG